MDRLHSYDALNRSAPLGILEGLNHALVVLLRLNLLIEYKITRFYPMLMEMYPFSIEELGFMIPIYEYLSNHIVFYEGRL